MNHVMVHSNVNSGKVSKSSYQTRELIKVIEDTSHGACVVRRLDNQTFTQRKFMR